MLSEIQFKSPDTLYVLGDVIGRGPDGIQILQEMELYAEVEAGGSRFVLTHAALENFDPEKPLDAYKLQDFLFDRPAALPALNINACYNSAAVHFGLRRCSVYQKSRRKEMPDDFGELWPQK